MEGRTESILPLIKCSTCGQDINMMYLADHVCLPLTSKPTRDDARSAPSAGRTNLNYDFAVQSNPRDQSQDPAVQQGMRFHDLQQSTGLSGFLKPGRNVPPKIDAVAANRPFLRPDDTMLTPISEYSNYGEQHSRSPYTPLTQMTTPSSIMSRKLGGSALRSQSPPSPEYASNLDSAFPPIRSFQDSARPSLATSQNGMRMPKSPATNVLQRMDVLAVDGPFSNQATARQHYQPAQAMRDVQPLREPFSSQRQDAIPQIHDSRISVPFSVASDCSNYSNESPKRARKGASDASRRAVNSIDRFLQDMDPVAQPAPMLHSDASNRMLPKHRNPYESCIEPSRSAADDRQVFFTAGLRTDEAGPIASAGVSRTRSNGNKHDIYSVPSMPGPFVPAVRLVSTDADQDRPRVNRPRAVTHTNSPEQDSKSPWFEAPRPSPAPPRIQNASLTGARARARTFTRENGPTPTKNPYAMQSGMPALPVMQMIRKESIQSDFSHSPSLSSSSLASSNPSTAATSVGSLSREPSSNSTNGRRRSLLRQQRLDPLLAPLLPAAGSSTIESLIDPAIQSIRDSPQKDDKSRTGSSGPKSYINDSPLRENEGPQINVYDQKAPTFPKPSCKGQCRGCDTPIYGKSVKAADGRLSGRYHKECFTCKTCQEPFPTAEFYVLNDTPYCGRHYHEQNGSLCRKCDHGIEGQYLETDRREKFHSHCFSCTHCRMRLNEDYYEVSGMPYCERHAFAMSRQRGPGAPVAEKRRTRLMFI